MALIGRSTPVLVITAGAGGLGALATWEAVVPVVADAAERVQDGHPAALAGRGALLDLVHAAAHRRV